jgi:hypothetical protein
MTPDANPGPIKYEADMLNTILTQSVVFWVVTACSLVGGYQHSMIFYTED